MCGNQVSRKVGKDLSSWTPYQCGKYKSYHKRGVGAKGVLRRLPTKVCDEGSIQYSILGSFQVARVPVIDGLSVPFLVEWRPTIDSARAPEQDGVQYRDCRSSGPELPR